MRGGIKDQREVFTIASFRLRDSIADVPAPMPGAVEIFVKDGAMQILNSDGQRSFVGLKYVDVPTSSAAVGEKGMYSHDSSYLYLCVSTNFWRRIQWSAW